MPIHRGSRLTDLISRAICAIPIQANIYKTWPNLAVGVTVGSSTTAPGWVEFVSAASAPTSPFTITHIVATNGIQGNAPCHAEVGMGAVGSEVAVAVYGLSAYNNGWCPGAPLAGLPIIPGGTRVAIRIWGPANAWPSIKIISCLLPTRLDPFSTLRLTPKFTTYYPGRTGLITVGSVNPISSATAWTYGNYLELHPAADDANPNLITGVTGLNYNGDQAQVAWATGAAGSEVVWGEFPFTGTDNPSLFLPIPVSAPGSTRYSVKAAYPTAGATTVSAAGLFFARGPLMP